jgi:hypothetical protein
MRGYYVVSFNVKFTVPVQSCRVPNAFEQSPGHVAASTIPETKRTDNLPQGLLCRLVLQRAPAPWFYVTLARGLDTSAKLPLYSSPEILLLRLDNSIVHNLGSFCDVCPVVEVLHPLMCFYGVMLAF